jgi:putative intracellular protease/amidase
MSLVKKLCGCNFVFSKMETMKKQTKGIWSICFVVFLANIAYGQTTKQNAFTQKQKTMKQKVLFVVTSHATKGSTGQPTGYYLSEVSHPWHVLTQAGYEIDFVSPLGGQPPADGVNLNDPINKMFVGDAVYQNKINHSMKPADVDPAQYVAIHYAGGHGTMWDFADDTALAKIAAKIYEHNGAVSAVCHGPAGLVNIKLSNGKYLVDGKKLNAFTNEEEIAVKLENVVPFMLETKLIERGAKFEKAGLWQEKVVVDDRLITGQNPASAKKVGEELLKVLQAQKN